MVTALTHTACRIVIAVFVLLAAVSSKARAEEQATGSIRGVVADRDTGHPIGAVRINVMEALRGSASSSEGTFIVEGLNPGTYTVSFARDGFVRVIVTDVIVQAGQLTELRVEMSQEILEMDELVVTAGDLFSGSETGLLEIRQFSAQLKDAISADLMKKAAASTAADALKLVVGTSVQEGKYVVIRGLADRYTSTQMNNVRLPTADSDRRAVQVDQFPAAQIESISVTKSFTPDQQGEATGGSVNIKTRSIPEERFLTLSGAVEYNTQTTGEEYLTYKGGGTGAFGIDNGDRDLPFRAAAIPIYSGATTDPNLGRERLPNAVKITQQTDQFTPVIGTSTATAGPNYNFSLAGGDKFNLGGEGNFGVLGAFSYRRKFSSYDDGERNSLGSINSAGEPVIYDEQYNDTRGVEELQWSASLGLGYQLAEHHALSLTLMHNQNTSDEARFLEDPGLPTQVEQRQSIRYNERATQTFQLRGDHLFEDALGMKLDWTASYNTSSQYEPDQRFFNTDFDSTNDRFTLSGEGLQSVQRIWRDVDEDSKQATFNLTIPFTQWSDSNGYVKFGPFVDVIDREYQQDSFYYLFATQAGGGQAVGENNTLLFYAGPGHFSDVFLNSGRVGLATNNPPAVNQLLWYAQGTGADVDYTGAQQISAGYGMVELPLSPRLKLIGGARAEHTDMTIDISSPRGVVQIVQRGENGNWFLQDKPDAEAGAAIEQLDILPAAGLVWEIVPNLNMRANWAQTIARPTFRELAPVRTFEFLGADQFLGNPDLVISSIDNYDLRFEWFRRLGDVLAFSLFYKEITDPIELILINISGGEFSRPENYDSGTVAGIEFEARQKLDILHNTLRYFTIGMNATLIESEVEIPENDQLLLASAGIDADTRPLLGQPEYLFNVNLVFDHPNWGTSVGLFYNMIGKRLIRGESFSDGLNPNVFEEPSDRLDFTLEQKIGKHWSVAFRAKNLTDPLIETAYEVDWVDDPITRTAFRRGREFSIGATCKW
jgi:hypothetical protein